jgi:hypothetical protein
MPFMGQLSADKERHCGVRPLGIAEKMCQIGDHV